MFKDWCIATICEFAPNKILATTLGNCLFIIVDFSVAKFIDGKNYEDIWKINPHPLPNFDEEQFPFILLSGAHCASIVNVRDGFHQPLINQSVMNDTNLTGLFAKEEEYGISIHWTNQVDNSAGQGE